MWTSTDLFRASVLWSAASSCRNSKTARTLRRVSALWSAASSCRHRWFKPWAAASSCHYRSTNPVAGGVIESLSLAQTVGGGLLVSLSWGSAPSSCRNSRRSTTCSELACCVRRPHRVVIVGFGTLLVSQLEDGPQPVHSGGRIRSLIVRGATHTPVAIVVQTRGSTSSSCR